MGSRRAMAHIIDDNGGPYEQLITAVIWRAAEDAQKGDGEAAAWLRSEGACGLYDAPDLSPMFRAGLTALVYPLASPVAATAQSVPTSCPGFPRSSAVAFVEATFHTFGGASSLLIVGFSPERIDVAPHFS